MENGNASFEVINLSLDAHQKALISLLNDYMQDDMGASKSLDPTIAWKIVSDLYDHPGYKGFLLRLDEKYVALANCFVNYSTFNAKPFLNIHDFVVSPSMRRMGLGNRLLGGIISYATNQGYCKVNLEVREDNSSAMALYRKIGFKPCSPNMFFWEKTL